MGRSRRECVMTVHEFMITEKPDVPVVLQSREVSKPQLLLPLANTKNYPSVLFLMDKTAIGDLFYEDLVPCTVRFSFFSLFVTSNLPVKCIVLNINARTNSLRCRNAPFPFLIAQDRKRLICSSWQVMVCGTS